MWRGGDGLCMHVPRIAHLVGACVIVLGRSNFAISLRLRNVADRVLVVREVGVQRDVGGRGGWVKK